MEIDEQGKKLKLWVRRKKAGLKLICSRCGQHVPAARIHEVCEREVRDLPCFEYTTTVVVETYRVKCPRCGIRAERVAQLPSKAPYSKRFEEAVGQACESAAARQVGRRMGLAASTVRAIDLRYLERWDARRRQTPLRQMGVDEIYRGKKGKFLTVVCNLATGEPLWFGRERKKETLDDFFRSQLVSRQRKRIEAACVDMWEPFRTSILQMGAAVQDHLRQVPHHAARQRCHRRSAEGGVFPARAQEAGAHQREEMVAAESLEEPDPATPR